MIYCKLNIPVPVTIRWVPVLLLVFAFIAPQPVSAQMGECVDCHTMHNSQNALPMRFDTGVTPLPQLLRGDCLGCHAQGLPSAIVNTGASRIPQVYHVDFAVPELAGGNFAYIDGTFGSGASDGKGHNITALTGSDGTLSWAPGGIRQSAHYGAASHIQADQLTCAGDLANGGNAGCHGNRNASGFGLGGITGAHHDNQSGALTPGAGENRAGYGYRFLVGVQGYEDTNWQYSVTPTDHNEYFGATSPAQLGCSGGAVLSCHGSGGVRPPNGTMSEFCATCHGNFHTLTVGSGDDTVSNSSGIGTGVSPFIRHPADLSIPATGEYNNYTVYELTAPIARLVVPGSSGNTVTPGSDAVMCLSCHVAHGSDFQDMLRFDYTLMDIGAGGGASGTGCFACHTSKD